MQARQIKPTESSAGPVICTYFALTIIYLLLIPFAVSVLFIKLSANNIYWGAPVISFGLTFLYGYLILTAKAISKPDSMFGIYLPVFCVFFWQLFWIILFNQYGWTINLAPYIFSILSFNCYGIHSGNWHSIIWSNMFYTAVVLLAFTAGERLAAVKLNIRRRKLKPGWIAITVICCISIYLLSEYFLLQKKINLLYEGKTIDYGFDYEHGLSSIDLEPYYVENEDNILVTLQEPCDFTIADPEEMPVLDGAEAAYPVYSAFAAACYENIDILQTTAKNHQVNQSTYSGTNEIIMPVQFSNTIISFKRLLSGKIDIFFGAKPSESQYEMAKMVEKDLVLTPIGKEAFVFFVNAENPIDELTSDQIRDIYSGKITNWHDVGGEWNEIQAFQRPENSGSQTMMEYFMGDSVLKAPLTVEYIAGMGSVIEEVADYQNQASSIGYSFRYYASVMAADSASSDAGIKFLAVDGIYPDEENIRSGKYPLTTELYAITLADNPNEHIIPFLEWMTGRQGQQIISDTGYVSLK